MRKINPHDQVVLNFAAVLAAAKPYGIQPVSYVEIVEGISNTVVFLTDQNNDNYFLKFYRSTYNEESISNELRLVKALADAKLPVPPYIMPLDESKLPAYEDEHGRHLTTITKKIPGRHPDQYSTTLIKDLGALHGATHRHSPVNDKVSGFNPGTFYSFMDLSPESDAWRVDQAVRAVFTSLDDTWSQLPAGIVPMDIKHDNVLCVDDTITGLVDFADAMHAPFIFCLASALWDVLEMTNDMELVTAYVRAYETQRPLSNLERESLYATVLTRGWITLHGYLLTGQSEAVDRQVALLETYADKPSPF